MKTRILLFFAVLFAADATALAAPETPLTVAVYGFVGKLEAARLKYGEKVTALVTADLTSETNLVMVERSDLKRALGEQAFGISGMVNSEQAAKIGQITGATVLVSGLVIKNGKDHLVIVANIVGTETGRLFAEKVEGDEGHFADLASELSNKIARKIHDEASNFANKTQSHEERLDRILKNVTGTNRPMVWINIHWPQGPSSPCMAANTEWGLILQKAGFVVVDGKSERKPDVEITGQIETDAGPHQAHLYSTHAVIDVKVQERQTGKIISFDHQAADAVDIGQASARKSAAVSATDDLAERIVPLIAK